MPGSDPRRPRAFSSANGPQESLREQFFDASQDAIVCADEQGVIILWNEAAERLLGYSAAEAIGRPLDMIVPEAMRGEHIAGIRRVVAGGAPRLVAKPMEIPVLRADGTQFPAELRISLWRRDGRMVFGAVLRDASERRRAQDQLRSLAHFDQLTMLPNRHLFLRRLQEAMQEAPAALIVLDLDRFSELNDAAGHRAGDRLLKLIAIALKRLFGPASDWPKATVGRIGPNQFGVVLPDGADLLAAIEASDKTLDVVRATISDAGAGYLTASIGLTVGPEHGDTAARLLANADFALRRAKLDGGDRRQLFLPAHRRAVLARRDLEAELARAWTSSEFEVFFQPQVRFSDHAIVGAEALLRWRHPERGVLTPGSFLHALEGGPLAERVGDWVLETACARAVGWRSVAGDQFRIGVNLFERQLLRIDMASKVAGALHRTGLPPEALEVEITENVMTAADTAHLRRVRALRDLGVGISFDDYGTGYASLSLLKRYPITRLKIDRSFVRDLSVDEDDAAIVGLVISLGERFGLEVIAEGVETTEQESLLVGLGCREGQGYLFGPPLTARDFQAAVERGFAPAMVA